MRGPSADEHFDVRDLPAWARRRLTDRLNMGTGGCPHAERVRVYSRLLASDLLHRGVYPAEVGPGYPELIRLASGHHDIGKAAIPSDILCKPASLSRNEYERIKMHTTIGAAALHDAVEQRPDDACPRMCRDIALYHHERWDGTGYPFGLEGERIPLSARLVALADVYDALTSQRAYKAAWSHASARAAILEASGSQFDPEVVRSFVAQEHAFCTVLRRGVPMERTVPAEDAVRAAA